MRRFALLVGLLAVAMAGGARAAVLAPASDPFYTPPAGYQSAAPGTILRTREVSVVGLTQVAQSTAYQLLYRSEDATGEPIAAVTTLILPSHPSSGPRRLLSYQTAEDSLSLKCAPSYTLQTGSGSTQSVESGEIALGLLQGWDVAVPDYEGPRSEYAVGPLAGRVTLDGIRAVEQFTAAGLEGAATKVALTGYSGGSIPSIWANALASSYAPSVNLVGNAVGGIVPDPVENLAQVNGSVFAGVIVAASVGVNRAYPSLDLPAILSARGAGLAATDGDDGDGCSGGVTNAPFDTVAELTHYATPAALTALPQVHSAFAHLDLIGGPKPEAPSYFWNAIDDEIAVIGPVDQYYASACQQGAVIDYYRSPVGEHLTGAGLYVPQAISYLEDRFAGDAAPDTCPSGTANGGPVGPPATTPAGTAPSAPACSPVRGRLQGSRLGPVALGERRAQARRSFARVSSRGAADVFCLHPGAAIEVVYRSGRVALALTANTYYALGGVRPGERLTVAERRRCTAALTIGRIRWYLTATGRAARGVLEVRSGVVRAVGIVAASAVSSTADARRLL